MLRGSSQKKNTFLLVDRFCRDFGTVFKVARRRHFVRVIFPIKVFIFEIVRYFEYSLLFSHEFPKRRSH